MKNKAIKTKLLTVLLTLCMVLSLVPMTAFAADPATETADFTASDGGAAAIALLNAAKWDNAENSTWDSATKTLTLKGVNFQTTAGAVAVLRLAAGQLYLAALDRDESLCVKRRGVGPPRGIDAYGASVSVSGSGKLTGDAADKHGGLSWGVYISGGDLTVSDSANVFAHVHTGIEVSSGNLIQTGGRIDAGTVAGGYYGLLVERNPYDVGKTVGNATVSGGTLDVSLGEIYFSVYGAAENQGNFTVSGEGTTVYAKSIDGVRTLAITDATMRSGSISAEKLTLQSGSLTVTESVREYNSKLYANPALSLQDLTINGGTLNVSWYWGENTPIVFPVDDETGFPTPLVKIWGDGREATFNGGVSTFDTGCAGNIALKLGKLSLGENMRGMARTR